MHAQDMFNHDNNRMDAIDKLITFCADNNLSYSYSGNDFTVKLPEAEPLPTVVEQNVATGTTRKSFDTSTWGEKGIDELQLPNTGEELEEGQPPKGEEPEV